MSASPRMVDSAMLWAEPGLALRPDHASTAGTRLRTYPRHGCGQVESLGAAPEGAAPALRNAQGKGAFARAAMRTAVRSHSAHTSPIRESESCQRQQQQQQHQPYMLLLATLDEEARQWLREGRAPLDGAGTKDEAAPARELRSKGPRPHRLPRGRPAHTDPSGTVLSSPEKASPDAAHTKRRDKARRQAKRVTWADQVRGPQHSDGRPGALGSLCEWLVLPPPPAESWRSNSVQRRYGHVVHPREAREAKGGALSLAACRDDFALRALEAMEAAQRDSMHVLAQMRRAEVARERQGGRATKDAFARGTNNVGALVSTTAPADEPGTTSSSNQNSTQGVRLRLPKKDKDLVIGCTNRLREGRETRRGVSLKTPLEGPRKGAALNSPPLSAQVALDLDGPPNSAKFGLASPQGLTRPVPTSAAAGSPSPRGCESTAAGNGRTLVAYPIANMMVRRSGRHLPPVRVPAHLPGGAESAWRASPSGNAMTGSGAAMGAFVSPRGPGGLQAPSKEPTNERLEAFVSPRGSATWQPGVALQNCTQETRNVESPGGSPGGWRDCHQH